MSIGPIETPSATSGFAKETSVHFEVSGTDISGKVVLTTTGFATQQQLDDQAQYIVDMLAADPTFTNVYGTVAHDSYQTITPTP